MGVISGDISKIHTLLHVYLYLQDEMGYTPVCVLGYNVEWLRDSLLITLFSVTGVVA